MSSAKGIERFNPVQPLLSVVLYLGGLTHADAMEIMEIGLKPFRSLLTPGVQARRVYIAKAGRLLGLEPTAWLQLVAEFDAAAAAAVGTEATLEQFPSLYQRVVQLARERFGASQVDARLLKLQKRKGRNLALSASSPPYLAQPSADFVGQTPRDFQPAGSRAEGTPGSTLGALGVAEHVGAEIVQVVLELEQALVATAENLRTVEAGIGRLAVLIRGLRQG